MLKLITISYIIMFTQNRIKQYLLYFQISPQDVTQWQNQVLLTYYGCSNAIFAK